MFCTCISFDYSDFLKLFIPQGNVTMQLGAVKY